MEETKKIKINENEISVVDIYPYRYDYGKGKEVLRIKISEEKHSFQEIKDILKDCASVIQYFVNDELKNEYENYSIDFNCQYKNGVYEVELTRVSQQEQEIAQLNEAILDIAMMLGGK